MKVNWKGMLIYLIGGTGIGLSAYVCGHATAMHEYAKTEDQVKMLYDEKGNCNFIRYCKEALKDYKRMVDNPCKIN